MECFDYSKAALLILDLQKGITAAYDDGSVVSNARKLIDAFRANGGFIAFVNVAFLDGTDRFKPITDTPFHPRQYPADWAEFAPELGVRDSDYKVTKRCWGAFFGTDLDLQLRRRNIDTLVLSGISTTMCVDTTARDAMQYGYHQIFITDAMKAATQEEHDAAVKYSFPKMGRIRTTKEFLAMRNA